MLILLGGRDLVALYTPSTGLLFQQQHYPEESGLTELGFVQTYNKRQLWPNKKNITVQTDKADSGFFLGRVTER